MSNDKVTSVLSRIHDYLKELIRDGLVEDASRASDLADDVHDLLREIETEDKAIRAAVSLPPLSDTSICLAKYTPEVTDKYCHSCDGKGWPCFHREPWNVSEREMLEKIEGGAR